MDKGSSINHFSNDVKQNLKNTIIHNKTMVNNYLYTYIYIYMSVCFNIKQNNKILQTKETLSNYHIKMVTWVRVLFI